MTEDITEIKSDMNNKQKRACLTLKFLFGQINQQQWIKMIKNYPL